MFDLCISQIQIVLRVLLSQAGHFSWPAPSSGQLYDPNKFLNYLEKITPEQMAHWEGSILVLLALATLLSFFFVWNTATSLRQKNSKTRLRLNYNEGKKRLLSLPMPGISFPTIATALHAFHLEMTQSLYSIPLRKVYRNGTIAPLEEKLNDISLIASNNISDAYSRKAFENYRISVSHLFSHLHINKPARKTGLTKQFLENADDAIVIALLALGNEQNTGPLQDNRELAGNKISRPVVKNLRASLFSSAQNSEYIESSFSPRAEQFARNRVAQTEGKRLLDTNEIFNGKYGVVTLAKYYVSGHPHSREFVAILENKSYGTIKGHVTGYYLTYNEQKDVTTKHPHTALLDTIGPNGISAATLNSSPRRYFYIEDVTIMNERGVVLENESMSLEATGDEKEFWSETTLGGAIIIIISLCLLALLIWWLFWKGGIIYVLLGVIGFYALRLWAKYS